MRPLKVALVTRPGSVPGERNVGLFAYPVPELTWRHFEVPKRQTVNRRQFTGFDVILWEDGKSVIHWEGEGPPLAYLVGDSTLSVEHYQRRLALAKQADLILVDWDRLERFASLGRPVRRLAYCVNERRFRDYGEAKVVDVAYHLSEDTAERHALGDWLGEFCQARGYTYVRGQRFGDDYAISFNRAKVTVNLNRNAETRNHRLFDAMACRTCVVTDPVPEVSGEVRAAGVEYVEWGSLGDLAFLLPRLLDTGAWRTHADCGYDLTHQLHTWRVRAGELRAVLGEVLGV